MNTFVERLSLPKSMTAASRQRLASQRAAMAISTSAAAAAAAATASPSPSNNKRNSNSSRGKANLDVGSDEFQAKFADTVAAINYCYQRSPDSVAANAMAIAAADDFINDGQRQREEEEEADETPEDRWARHMHAAYDAVYQAWQPMMLLTEEVVAHHDATHKEEVPAHLADDVAKAIHDMSAQHNDSNLWLGNAHKRNLDAELVIGDPELAAIMLSVMPDMLTVASSSSSS